ncbi:MAG: integration host factor subunit beta [Acidobacteria bacterium]|nr:integration host factor subunit beta [Acidobacteriota bacterium]
MEGWKGSRQSRQRVRDRNSISEALPQPVQGATMTKADLVDEVSRATDLSRKDSEVIVEALFDSVVKALKNSDKLEVRGFGSFRIRKRKARQGRNPKTGEKVDVPEKKVPYFKPSKELKDLINLSS